MTQVTLAKKVRVTREYIAMLETGARQSPSLPMLKRIAPAPQRAGDGAAGVTRRGMTWEGDALD
jgi:transcriptional regulator with XRE-family HTH domain